VRGRVDRGPQTSVDAQRKRSAAAIPSAVQRILVTKMNRVVPCNQNWKWLLPFFLLFPSFAFGQTAPGQVMTYQGPSLGNQWIRPADNVLGYAAGISAFLAAPSSNSLANIVINRTGTGPVVFGVNPNLTSPYLHQPSPATVTASGPLTASQIATGIVIVNKPSGGAVLLSLPSGAAMDLQFQTLPIDFSYDFSIINVSNTNSADASVTASSGWSLEGYMTVVANAGAAARVPSALFRARRIGTSSWTLYRIG
jgi:hypothetical protein